ncbi:hypothetical protein EVAR_74190_1 [Eumeta japonica]|uniref:Uncharacterized protein n=1 Tax=Eumeta variegata TaxID=151549 RepID=A0A4C1SEH8_EUMVA|nr:hypothetical protein EVAR_74190_1 [Eumeta japonica]
MRIRYKPGTTVWRTDFLLSVRRILPEYHKTQCSSWLRAVWGFSHTDTEAHPATMLSFQMCTLAKNRYIKISRSSPRIDACGTLRVTTDREERDTEPLPLRTSTN